MFDQFSESNRVEYVNDSSGKKGNIIQQNNESMEDRQGINQQQ